MTASRKGLNPYIASLHSVAYRVEHGHLQKIIRIEIEFCLQAAYHPYLYRHIYHSIVTAYVKIDCLFLFI